MDPPTYVIPPGYMGFAGRMKFHLPPTMPLGLGIKFIYGCADAAPGVHEIDVESSILEHLYSKLGNVHIEHQGVALIADAFGLLGHLSEHKQRG